MSALLKITSLALLVGSLTIPLTAAKPGPVTAGISLSPSAWSVRYSSGVTLSALSGMAGWSFLFPTGSGHVNYLTTPTSKPLTGSLTFTAQVIVTSGVPRFLAAPEVGNTCDTPASVRAYVEQVYDARGPGHDIIYAPATYRWWSNPIALQLSEGVATVTTPIDPSQWSDTDGHLGTDELVGFQDAMAHPAAVGLTFGSGCFFGHGVVVSGGTARFVLTNFQVQ